MPQQHVFQLLGGKQRAVDHANLGGDFVEELDTGVVDEGHLLEIEQDRRPAGSVSGVELAPELGDPEPGNASLQPECGRSFRGGRAR